MGIEQALKEHEEQVDVLLKASAKYVTSLKAWKKSCQTGQIGTLVKSAANASELARLLPEPTSEVAATWNFDVREYLESGEWREDLQNACEAIGIRALEEEGTLVSPPVIVRAQPGNNRLQIGKVNWPTIHPQFTAAYLKKLKERSTSVSALQQFLNALYEGAKKVSREGNNLARFRDIYDLFALAPGWKKENSTASFAQQIYTLHRSEVRTTKNGKTFEIEWPTGKPSENDIFGVISDDGRPIRYYGIWFR